MKWMKSIPVKAVGPLDHSPLGTLILPQTESMWGNIEPMKPIPEPKDIPLNLALDALGAHGVMIKHMNQTTSYGFEGIEFDLSMTILVDPKSGQQTLNQLNDWFFSKAYKKW